MSSSSRPDAAGLQRGGVAVEFTLVVLMFIYTMLAMFDFCRWLYAMNAATEATREGARTAVVCNPNSAALVRAKMQPFLNLATPGTINVEYLPAGCDQSNCQAVRVSLSDYTVPTFAPMLPAQLQLPASTTHLPRELMDSTNNARCTL